MWDADNGDDLAAALHAACERIEAFLAAAAEQTDATAADAAEVARLQTWLAALRTVQVAMHPADVPDGARVTPAARQEIASLGWVRVTLREPRHGRKAGATFDVQVNSYRGHTPALDGMTYRHCSFSVIAGNYRELSFDTADAGLQIEALHEVNRPPPDRTMPDARRILRQFENERNRPPDTP